MTFLHADLVNVANTNSCLLDAITNPDLLAVSGFSAVGLLLTVIIAHAFPIGELANLFALLD